MDMALYLCKQCGKEFRRSGKREAVFCSLTCKGIWQRDSKEVSREWLYQKYVEEGLGTYQIGRIVGRNAKRVYEWLQGYNIPTRERTWGTTAGSLPYHNPQWLRREYVKNKRSASSIAEQFGVQPANIYFFLRKFGIKRRNTSQVRAIKHWGAPGESNPMFGKRGAQTPNWKGGITPDRQAFYQSNEWKNAVRVVWKRDKGICQRCGKRSGSAVQMHIHHIVSFAIKELRTEPSNLVLLCDPCHHWVHSKKNTIQEFIRSA
jgi:transposase